MDLLVDALAYLNDRASWRGSTGLAALLREHVAISAWATALAMVLALPVGLTLGHTGRGATLAINVANVGRALPSFAVLVIALQFLSIGTGPTLVALVLLAVPPMVTNAYVGVSAVEPEAREAARGMGMTGRQVFTRVELPLSIPLVMAGVRTATVQVVATATLAALVGYGGLGALILLGLRTGDDVRVLAGALVVAALAIATELVLGAVQRRLTPKALRGRTDAPLVGSPPPDETSFAGV